MTVQQDVRAAGLRGLCGGAVHLPGDTSYDLARTPWNLAVDDHPAAVAYPGHPDEVAEVLCAAAAAGLSVAAQGTGHGAPPLSGRLVRRRAAAHVRDERDRHRPRPSHRARRRRRALGRPRGSSGAARPGGPAPVVPRRRRGRLLDRRRDRLVRATARAAVQRRHRCRAGARRRDVRPRHRRERARPLLGDPGRWHAARRRLRAGVPAAPDRVGGGGVAGVGLDGRRAGAAGVGRLVRRRHPRPPPRPSGCSPSPTTPRPPPSCAGDGWRSSTARSSATTSPPARSWPRCAPSRPRSTPSRGCLPRRWSGCTWTPRAPRPPTRAAPCSRACPALRWTPSSTRSAPVRAAASS